MGSLTSSNSDAASSPLRSSSAARPKPPKDSSESLSPAPPNASSSSSMPSKSETSSSSNSSAFTIRIPSSLLGSFFCLIRASFSKGSLSSETSESSSSNSSSFTILMPESLALPCLDSFNFLKASNGSCVVSSSSSSRSSRSNESSSTNSSSLTIHYLPVQPSSVMNRFKIDLGKFKIDLKLLGDLFFLTGAGLSMYYLINHMLNDGADSSIRSKEAKKKSVGVLKKIHNINPDLKNVNFTEYEKALLNSLIIPDDIKVSFNDVGGLNDIIDELREAVILPLTEPDLFAMHATLIQSPKGVLFYGPPGCGKTMLAKAIAKESGAFFLAIRMSTIMDKWYGESNKIVDAIFSLANKLQPCIIFIDEIDSFLRDRSSTDHEVSAMLKAEFMTLWDGLVSNGRIMVMGATNRQNDIDSAFMRRMPKQFSIGKPNAEQRRAILRKILKDTQLANGFDLESLVASTRGYSGSDLKELCREAALNSMRDYIRLNYKDGKKLNDPNDSKKVTPLRTVDFLKNIPNAIPPSTVD